MYDSWKSLEAAHQRTSTERTTRRKELKSLGMLSTSQASQKTKGIASSTKYDFWKHAGCIVKVGQATSETAFCRYCSYRYHFGTIHPSLPRTPPLSASHTTSRLPLTETARDRALIRLPPPAGSTVSAPPRSGSRGYRSGRGVPPPWSAQDTANSRLADSPGKVTSDITGHVTPASGCHERSTNVG